MDDDVIRALNEIASILRLAHSNEIAAARAKIREDEVSNGILEAAASDFIASGDLKSKIAKSTKQSEKTVQRRIADLVAMGALEKKPIGSPAYRATGLI